MPELPEVEIAARLLEGRAGVALALCAIARGTPPASGWDTCLLIT